MNRTMKKILSVITTLSMCASIIGVMPVLAAGSTFSGGSGARDDPYLTSMSEYEDRTTNRNLYVDFMGVGDSPGAGKKSGNLSSTNINNTFWVGVAVDKVNDLNLFTDGVYSLELAFEYDPNFVRPDIKDSSGSMVGTETEKDDRWNAKIAGVNIGSEADKIWNSNYTSIAVYDTDIDPNTDRANKDLLEERQNWKMCTVSVTLTAQDVQDLSFKGLSSPDKQYLLKLPFILVGAPSDNAPDPNPIVLSLIRGPETFDIGSGSNGEVPNAKWNETENQGALNNLKTYFDFAGDVRLFGESTSIEDITPFRMVPKLDNEGNPIEENGEIVKVEEEYKLSYDNTLSEEDFNPEVDTYYLSISNDPDNLQLRIKTDSQPYIYLNGSTTPIVTSSVTGGFVTAEIPLRELDVSTKDQDNGFNNTISIRGDPTSQDSLYTIFVRRLLKPKIVLKYGNSPVGQIRKDNIKYPTVTDKEVAINDFNNSLNFNNFTYYEEAWSSYATFDDGEPYNGDKDEFSIFIYQRQPFKDPGFILYDCFGDESDPNEVSLSLSMISFKGGMPQYTDEDSPNIINEEGNGSEYIFKNFTNYNIRPDVYTIKYNYNDTTTHSVATAVRKVIAISRLGDARIDANNIVNNLDASLVKTYSGKMNVSNSIYKYKICDGKSDLNKIINNLDASTIKSKGMSLPILYTALEKE